MRLKSLDILRGLDLWLLPLLFVFAFVSLDGAEKQYHPLSRNLSYQTFNNISLPFDANYINAVFQDDKGMIWLGTRRGLYSFNGYDLHDS